VPYKGPLEDTVYQIIGGLRAGMGLCGAANLTELKKKTEMVKISPAGMSESHPHSVSVTKEAPNYRRMY
jgi:IMP dehydrogenase